MGERRLLVRASDLGLWSYCHRAWWLARIQGVAHRKPALFAQGTKHHEAHGQLAARAQGAAQWSQRLIAIGLILLGVVLIFWLLGMS